MQTTIAPVQAQSPVLLITIRLTTGAPTVTLSLGEGATTIGDSTITLTFSEAVQGVSVDATTGSCSGTVTLTTTADTATCLAPELTGSEASYTVDPSGDLVDGNYALTVTTGISSSASSTAGGSVYSKLHCKE